VSQRKCNQRNPLCHADFKRHLYRQSTQKHTQKEKREKDASLPQRDIKKVQSKKSALSCRFQEASVPTKHTQKHTQKEKKRRKTDASLPPCVTKKVQSNGFIESH